MYKGKYKKILELYVGLPYVVHKNKYLIPQKPIGLPRGNLIGERDNILGYFKNHLPELVNAQLISKAGDPTHSRQLVELYKSSLRQKRLEYFKKMKQYKATFIVPLLKPVKVSAGLTFYNSNKGILKSQLKAANKNLFFQMFEFFKQQPLKVQQMYIEKAERQFQERLANFKKAEDLYKIPVVKEVKPVFLYKKEMKEAQQGSKVVKYKELTDDAKKLYQAKCQALKAQQEQKLEKFLQERGLKLLDFIHIKTVCRQMEQIKKFMKLSKQKKKIQKQKDNQNKQEESLENLCLLEQEEESSESSESTSDMQEVGKKKQSVEQTSKQQKQASKSFDRKKIKITEENEQQDDNIDFDNDYIDIDTLRKQSDLIKKTPKS